MNPKPPPREQEQSIRARKEQLYEEDEAPISTEGKATKPFETYLREVPAAPLSAATKAILWAVGAVVVLLLIVTLLRATGGQTPATKKNANSTSNGARRLA